MELTKERLMVESIHAVGHSPNHQLGQPYTREFLKSGQGYWPYISFRGTYGDWKRRGKDEVMLARERMRRLLDTHEVTRPSAEVQKELRRLPCERTGFALTAPTIEAVFHP